MRILQPHALSPRALRLDVGARRVLDLLVPEVRHTDLAARVELDPGEVSPIGDWYLGEDDRWHHTDDVPPPDPTVTAMLPTVAPPPREQDDLSEHPGGDWANADAYLSYDGVDSCTVIDTGAP